MVAKWVLLFFMWLSQHYNLDQMVNHKMHLIIFDRTNDTGSICIIGTNIEWQCYIAVGVQIDVQLC
jgi:hypothetical protein